MNENSGMQSTESGRCLITCRLRRNTFIPGETIEGTVHFDVKASAANDDFIDIEQATVQAHGYVKVDPRWINLSAPLGSLFEGKDNVPPARYAGLDNDRSACLFASNSAVLLKKERLEVGEKQSFAFSVVLPMSLTPTFKGVGVRYAYAVSVSISREVSTPAATTRLLNLVRGRGHSSGGGQTSIKDLHVPFTILSAGLTTTASSEAGRIAPLRTKVVSAVMDTERLQRGVTDPHDQHAIGGGLVSGIRAVTWNMQGRLEDYDLEGMDTLASSDSRRTDGMLPTSSVYSIRNGQSRMGSFVLHKSAFRAGDIVLGNFDFSGATIRCMQICACLELTEENFHRLADGSASRSQKPTYHRRVVDASKELTPCVLHTSVTLALPMDAPASFSTEFVAVTWKLKFEFAIHMPQSQGAAGPSTSILGWEVPLRVVPPTAVAIGAVTGRERAFNAMDAIERKISC